MFRATAVNGRDDEGIHIGTFGTFKAAEQFLLKALFRQTGEDSVPFVWACETGRYWEFGQDRDNGGERVIYKLWAI